MKKEPQRKIFSIADMIVVGEKEGPLLPEPKFAGIIAMGEDIVSFDEIVATILGFDINKMPLFKNSRISKDLPICNGEDGVTVSNEKKFDNKIVENITREISINIEPSSGWKNHIELKNK